MVCTTRGFKFWSKQKWFGAKVLITTAFAVVVVIARGVSVACAAFLRRKVKETLLDVMEKDFKMPSFRAQRMTSKAHQETYQIVRKVATQQIRHA